MTETGAQRPRRAEAVIDVHCHRECAPAAEMMKAEADRIGYVPLAFGNDLTREVNRRQLLSLRPKMESLEVRLGDMDRMGVDVQAVSIAPYQTYYWAEPELGRQVSRLINDELAEAISAYPDRFVGMGTVPLQDTGAAIEELGRCVDELGFRGIEVGTNIEGGELSSERLAPFWAEVEARDILVFIHPLGFTHAERFSQHFFLNTLGHPLESTLALAGLIFDGIMEAHSGLKIVVAHGGGYLPAYPARIDHAYHAREDAGQGLPRPPGEYLRRFYFDTMVFDPEQLGFLIQRYGTDHILLGTDYPYDMGEVDPVGLVGKVPGLDDGGRAAICGGNAARLLGLS